MPSFFIVLILVIFSPLIHMGENWRLPLFLVFVLVGALWFVSCGELGGDGFLLLRFILLPYLQAQSKLGIFNSVLETYVLEPSLLVQKKRQMSKYLKKSSLELGQCNCIGVYVCTPSAY